MTRHTWPRTQRLKVIGVALPINNLSRSLLHRILFRLPGLLDPLKARASHRTLLRETRFKEVLLCAVKVGIG